MNTYKRKHFIHQNPKRILFRLEMEDYLKFREHCHSLHMSMQEMLEKLILPMLK